MKAKIQQVNRYTVTINGKVYEGFKKGGEWNGLFEFEGPSGKLVVCEVERNNFGSSFLELFGGGPPGAAKEFHVIKASPDLVDFKSVEDS